MKLHPYLSYPGTCAEALEFYKGILRGEIGETQLYDGSPMESPESKGKIMHTNFTFGDGNMFMASDVVGQPVAKESNVTLSISLNDVDESARIFNAMSAGGNVMMDLQQTFWAKKFGMFTDKFGISWMINCE